MPYISNMCYNQKTKINMCETNTKNFTNNMANLVTYLILNHWINNISNKYIIIKRTNFNNYKDNYIVGYFLQYLTNKKCMSYTK